ncbi:MAG TPA: hypothetical protein VND91_01075 [Candidatus Saccharimonadia bacterium]|nr:hypothetical protein [Candidatus Saccharimonadia bacterium]
MIRFALSTLACALLVACAHRTVPAPTDAAAGTAFFVAIEPHCGKAYEGRLVEGTAPGDAAIGAERLVMHVRDCSEDRLAIPFHVGTNRSRTWIVTRRAADVVLAHDHRHEDGAPDAVTQYGGATRGPADSTTLEFHADAATAAMIPAARTNIWTMTIEPGVRFTYALRRDAEGRRFRVDFDLTRPVAVPPPAW